MVYKEIVVLISNIFWFIYVDINKILMFGMLEFSCIWNFFKKKIYIENIDRLYLLIGYKSDGGGWLCRIRDGWI